MTTLITGGLGYIGINAAIELLLNNKKLILIDLPTSSPLIDFFNKHFSDKFKYYSLNLLDKNNLENIIKENPDINTVIHSAGYKMTSNNIDITKYYQNNITTTLNLLEIIKKYNINNFIFNSSANVYENSNNLNEQLENSELQLPNNIYGKSKLLSEKILKDLASSNNNNNLKITIIRIFNPIGIHPFFDNNIGYEILKKSNNLCINIASVLNREKENLEIFTNSDTDTTLDNKFIRDYISIVDLAKLYNHLINNFSNLSTFNIYNVGTGKGQSILELINIFEKVSDQKVNYIIKKTNKNIIQVSIANINKIKKELNWTPQETLESTCENIWKYFNKNHI